MPEPVQVEIRRVYDDSPSGGPEVRVLVDRLWPRGIPKEGLKLDLWAKEVAPSNELRRWFGHDPRRWEEFQKRYRFELAEKTSTLKELAKLALRGPLVLLYSARDSDHNQAIVLKDVLEEGIAH